MSNPFLHFDRFDSRLNRWLVAHSVVLLRISIGLVFLIFGVIKFFPGLSPIEELVKRTTTVLTFGMITPDLAIVLVAALESVIGLCFLTGRFLRVAVWLMLLQMIGAMSPLVLFRSELFPGPGLQITLTAQYIFKDIILVAAALVIAATWTGARIVATPTSMAASLRGRPARVETEEREKVSVGRYAAADD